GSVFGSAGAGIGVGGRAVLDDRDFWGDVRVSANEFVTGYLAAIVLAIPLGLVVGWYRRAQYLLGPFIDSLNAVPRVTFLPIIVVWFGIGLWSKFAVVFLGAIIPIIIATQAGVPARGAPFLAVRKGLRPPQPQVLP